MPVAAQPRGAIVYLTQVKHSSYGRDSLAELRASLRSLVDNCAPQLALDLACTARSTAVNPAFVASSTAPSSSSSPRCCPPQPPEEDKEEEEEEEKERKRAS